MTAPTWPIDRFLLHLAAAGRPASTRELRRHQLERIRRTCRVPVEEVTQDMLIEHLANPDWSSATRRASRSAARTFFAWTHSDGITPTNPADRLPSVRATVGRPRPATETAVKDAMATIDARQRLMVRLGAYAGLRACEIARVHKRDLIEDLLGYSLVIRGKGDRQRIIPLDDSTARLVGACDGWAFPGRVDGHLSAAYVSKLLSRALPDGVTGHMLRHRFASAAYALGGRDLLAVRDLLGHASVATTQVYTAVPDGTARAAVAAAAA